MSLWADRDLPVLRFLHDHPPHDGMLETNRLSEKPHSDLPQLTEQDVHIAVQTLHDVGYVDFENQEGESSGGVLWQDILVTGAGQADPRRVAPLRSAWVSRRARGHP